MASPVELPPKYYLDNFRFLLDFVAKMYFGLLNEEEKAFTRRFEGLSEDGQLLYVRLFNRRGRLHRPAKFSYPEIGDIDAALDELLLKGFASLLCEEDDLALALGKFNKTELIRLFPEETGWKKLKKPELLAQIQASHSSDAILERLCSEERVICQGFSEEARMLMFLFFGSVDYDLSEFVIRDVGHVTFEEFEASDMTPTFTDRAEAEAHRAAQSVYAAFRLVRDGLTGEELHEWYWQVQEELPEIFRFPSYASERLGMRVGQMLERAGLYEEAIEVFAQTVMPPASERRARLLVKIGKEPAALELCRRLLEWPANPEEAVFAADWLDKLEGRYKTRRTTRYLKSAEKLTVPHSTDRRVEALALEGFAEQGYEGFYSENYTWRVLFGLTLWPVIYDERSGAIHHPLQRVPSDLYGGFYANRQTAVEERLALLDDSAAFLKSCNQLYAEKKQVTNPFFGHWFDPMEQIETIVRLVPAEGLKAVLRRMAQNLKEYGKGFPDLFVYKDSGKYCFVEIKSPNDHLSAAQLHWLDYFERVSVNGKLVRLVWQANG